jgi:hypothetical protein
MNYLNKILFLYAHRILSRRVFYFNASYIVLASTLIPLLLLVVGSVISYINAKRHASLNNTNINATNNNVGIEAKKENSTQAEQQNISNDNTQKNNAIPLKENPNPYDNMEKKNINQSVNIGLPSNQKGIIT